MNDKDLKKLEEAYDKVNKQVHGIYEKGLHFRCLNNQGWSNVTLSTPGDTIQLGFEVEPEWAENSWDEWLNSVEEKMSKNGKFAYYDKYWNCFNFFETQEEAEKAYKEYKYAQMVRQSPLD